MWPVELVKRPWVDQPCPGECGVGPPIASACTFGSLARTPETRLLPCDWQFSEEKRTPLTDLPTERPRLPTNRTTLQTKLRAESAVRRCHLDGTFTKASLPR